MKVNYLTPDVAVSSQITASDIMTLEDAGFRTIICNRPDGESMDQPLFGEIEIAAKRAGIGIFYLPVALGKASDQQAHQFGALLASQPAPVLAYCRTGMRSVTVWAMAQKDRLPAADIVSRAKEAGYDLRSIIGEKSAIGEKLAINDPPNIVKEIRHDVVIVGGGAAGIATAASLLSRSPYLDVVIIDPAETHYYQPGWTMVGRGVFDIKQTVRPMKSLIPRGAHWLKASVEAFHPERSFVTLNDARVVYYRQLVVCPGLTLDWQAIEGLTDTLGRNGVTSNYSSELAPYTWKLVQSLRGGKALFTQPPMPIKCAGAPQKAMYLSADYWRQAGVLDKIDIEFLNPGAALFGVPEYVPALMEYVNLYGIDLRFSHTLVAVDGAAKTATFVRTGTDGEKEFVVKPFDMLHVVPPQKAPEFIRSSPLVDAAGWVDVQPDTMQHKKWPNIHALGDVGNTSNAKTAAAARAQAPVVAHNVLAAMGHVTGQANYNGYGSCPLTVECGKIVLAEFLYGGKVAPSFPKWLIDGTKPSRLAWLLKERILPPLYWHGMLKGHEWMVHPKLADVEQ